MNIAYHWKRKTTPILCMATGIALTASLMSRIAWSEALRRGAHLLELLVRRGQLLGARHRGQHGHQDADRADHEADVHPVGHAVAGGLVQRRHLLQDEQRQVRQHRAGPGEHALGQEPARQLRLGQPVGDERPVRLHRGVVAGVEQPEADHAQPQDADEREHEQDDRAEDRAGGDERATAAPAGVQVRSLIAPISGWMSSPVTGPARLRIGSWSGVAPISRKSGFTADWVRPKLNWTPKNPRFIISRALARHQRLALDLPGTRRDGL